MRLGIAHHFGWAVAVTTTDDHDVVDRRRLELVEPGVPADPVHHGIEGLDDEAAASSQPAGTAPVRAASAHARSDRAAGSA